MKKLLAILVLSLLWCNVGFADPVEYEDDWYLLDNTETNALEIKDSSGLIKLTAQDQNLILTSNNKTSSIYQFNKDKFDIYLVKKENDLNVIYIFNHTTKTLLAANVDKSGIIFKEMPWEYGLLMAIFKNCEWKKESYYGEIKSNYLASPPLVVAFALVGSVHMNIQSGVIGVSKDGKEVLVGYADY